MNCESDDKENMGKKADKDKVALRGRPSPRELERLLVKERMRRRRRRIQQVREQAVDMARGGIHQSLL
jgi:hypothetical protein